MRALDIFASDDMERPRAWLRTVLCPTLVNRRFLESRGFNASFVRRFDKKYSRVLRLDGTLARAVRGVNEVEFLRGVADALGVRPFEDKWDPRDVVTTTSVARQCLEALDRPKNGQGPTLCDAQQLDAVAKAMDLAVGAAPHAGPHQE
jgi:hypothetical protein